jgi:AcrR family transcriptional regulator
MPDDKTEAPAALMTAGAAIADAVERAEGKMTDNKRRVVIAAVLAFAEAGFDATSTKQIAQRAGVAEATIFRHFASKQDLLLRLFRPFADQVLLPAALDELREAMGHADSFEGMIRTLMHSRLRFARAHAPLVRIIVQEGPFQPELRAIAGRAFGNVGELLGQMMAREIAAGRIRPVAVGQVLRWFGSLFLGYFLSSTFFLPDADWDDDAEIDAMAKLIMQGLAA